jgi:hypothetical protein
MTIFGGTYIKTNGEIFDFADYKWKQFNEIDIYNFDYNFRKLPKHLSKINIFNCKIDKKNRHKKVVDVTKLKSRFKELKVYYFFYLQTFY